jgi:hypothetical protein
MFARKIVVIAASSTFIFAGTYPTYAVDWSIGKFVGNVAKDLGVSKKVTGASHLCDEYIYLQPKGSKIEIVEESSTGCSS